MLNAQLTEEDKDNIEFVEAFKLLRMTARPEESYTQNKSENWVKETVDRVLNTDEEQEEDDSDTETDTSTTFSETTVKPRRWTEIITNITTYQFISGFKV